MSKTKHRKRYSSSSSNSSSSSSSSSSNSSNSSADRKKRSKKSSEGLKNPKNQKRGSSGTLKENVKESRGSQRDEARLEAEQSKWDSPDDKFKKDSRRLEKPQRHSENDSRDRSLKHVESGGYERHQNRMENRHSKPQPRENKSHDRPSRNTSNSDKRERDNRESRTEHRSRGEERRSEERHRRDSHKNTERKYYSREDTRENRRGEYNSRRNNDYEERYERRNDYRNERYNRNKRRRSRSSSFNHKEAKWGKEDDNKQSKNNQNKEKEKPNFALSGKLTEETNTFRGIVIKYSEPPEARKPKRRWRLYPFKGDKALQTLYIHRESAYLIGRERKVVDLPIDHPSCSKQHAVLQYRLVPFTREDGSAGKRVRPYLIDLESANGTFINNKKIEPKRYVELLEKDVIKFGFSSREYVLLHENSKDEGDDDDVKDEEVIEKVKKEKD